MQVRFPIHPRGVCLCPLYKSSFISVPTSHLLHIYSLLLNDLTWMHDLLFNSHLLFGMVPIESKEPRIIQQKRRWWRRYGRINRKHIFLTMDIFCVVFFLLSFDLQTTILPAGASVFWFQLFKKSLCRWGGMRWLWWCNGGDGDCLTLVRS